MREFEVALQNHFKVGLRRGAKLHGSVFRGPLNEEALRECYNLKPSEGGLVPFEPLTNPFTSSPITWPFPQVFIGNTYWVYATQTELSQISSSWTLTSKLTSLGSGVTWDFADYWDFFIMTNGVKLVYIVNPKTTKVWTAATSLTSMPLVKTLCDYKGQLIGGNVLSAWPATGGDCDSNTVVWSTVGTMDFQLSSGGTGTIANIPYPQAGYYKMPWNGEVLRVRTLGEYFIVYGSNGIMAGTRGNEFSFKWTKLADFGICGRNAVGCGPQSHIFVSTDGYLYALTSGLDIVKRSGVELNRLGFKEFLYSMTPANIVISFDANENEFYITDGTYSYLLTQSGLCEVFQRPTTVFTYNGYSYGVFSEGTDEGFNVVTAPFDQANRAMKSAMVIEVGGTIGAGTATCGVEWSNTTGGTFTASPTAALSPKGVGFPIVTAVEHCFKVSGSDYSKTYIEFMKVRMKLSDKSSIRGVYGAGQTGKTADS